MTILFKKDWYDSKGKLRAYPDMSTKNLTFIRMAKLLRRMKIENHLFHLALYDQKLVGIDPHSLNATNDPSGELRARVALEAKRNVWYFVREVIKIPASGDSEPIQFQLNRGNLAMIWCFLANIDFNSTQPRQTGKAQTLDSMVLTVDGWARMGDLKPGDLVATPTGEFKPILGIFPQGEKAVYEVEFEDGRTTTVCGEHLWKVRDKYAPKSDEWKIVSTEELMRCPRSFCVPLTQPILRDDNILNTSPYEAGVVLASDSDVVLKGEAHEIVPGPLPAAYLDSSPDQVTSILRGFFDTVGEVDEYGYVTATVPYRDVAEQAQYLVRSLGGLCTIRVESPKEFVLCVRLNDLRVVFSDLDKRSLAAVRSVDDELNLNIKSIIKAGVSKTQCISIDHPEHLYITDEFIVTHNTICAMVLTSWVIYVNGINMSMAMVTHSEKLVSENVKRLKDLRAAMPVYLTQKRGDDVDNKQGLDYKALKNSYNTYIGQKDKLAANRVGRGSTSPVIHFDELAFIPNIRITFPAIMASTNRARQNAARVGMVHSNLYTTTAGDPSTDEGAYALEIISKAMKFTERLFDCVDKEDAHAVVAKNSTNKLVNGTFSYLQLGLTHEWFDDTINRNNVPPDEVERDYLNNWVSLAKNPIISKDILARMNATRMNDPMFNEIVGNYVISWYVPEPVATSREYRRKTPLIMGMDSSEMIDRDFTTFVAIDPTTLSVVFTFRCNRGTSTSIGIMVSRLMVDFPRMIFVPERKSTGSSIIDMVIDSLRANGENPFRRIFNRIVDNYHMENFKEYRLDDVSLCDRAERKYLGFMTTGASRELLYKSTLQQAARLCSDRVYDPTLIVELSGLQANNGRLDHQSGKHDDLVIAWLLACYLIFLGKNLEQYGLASDEIMRSHNAADSNKESVEHIAAQLQLRIKIREVEAAISNAKNEYIRQHHIHRKLRLLEHLDQTVQLDPVSANSVREDYAQYGDIYSQRSPDVDRKPVTSPINVINALIGM